MPARYDEQIKTITTQVVDNYYQSVALFTEDISSMIPGLEISRPTVYAWLGGQVPSYLTLLAILKGAEMAGNVRVAQWALEMLAVMQPDYWTEISKATL